MVHLRDQCCFNVLDEDLQDMINKFADYTKVDGIKNREDGIKITAKSARLRNGKWSLM